MTICGLMKTTLLDFPGHVACTVFTGGCNFRCPFCHNSDLLEFGQPSEYSEEEILSFLERRRHTLDGVAVTGGEPTLQKDLPDFLRKVRDRTGLPVKLDTNGISPELLKSLVEEGLIAYVAMDIKAAPENYAKVCGVNEDAPDEASALSNGAPSLPDETEHGPAPSRLHFDRITATKDYLLEGHLPYEFRTTVVGGLHAEADFRGIAEYIRGAERYFLQCYKDSGNILDREAGFREPTIEELKTYRAIVSPAVQHAEIRGVDVDI